MTFQHLAQSTLLSAIFLRLFMLYSRFDCHNRNLNGLSRIFYLNACIILPHNHLFRVNLILADKTIPYKLFCCNMFILYTKKGRIRTYLKLLVSPSVFRDADLVLKRFSTSIILPIHLFYSNRNRLLFADRHQKIVQCVLTPCRRTQSIINCLFLCVLRQQSIAKGRRVKQLHPGFYIFLYQ